LFVKAKCESVEGRPEVRLSGEFEADPNTPDFESPGAKTMKNLKSAICAVLLGTALSATTFAKPGVISTTKAGVISTTKTGVISTTGNRSGVISTTRTGVISTTRVNSSTDVNGFQLLDLLVTFINIW